MKRIALILTAVLLLTIFSSCTGNRPQGNEGEKEPQGNGTVTTEKETLLSDLFPEPGTRDPNDTDTPTSDDTIRDPSAETETVKPEDRPLFSVSAEKHTCLPKSYYTWSGELGKHDGAAEKLPLIASSLESVTYAEDLTFVLKEGASVVRLRVYDLDYEEIMLSGRTEAALSELKAGIYYVAVAVSEGESGSEFLFRLNVGVRIIVRDGDELLVPRGYLLSSVTYAEETGQWDITSVDISLENYLKENTPISVSYSEMLSFSLYGEVESVSITVYNSSLQPTDSFGDNLYPLNPAPTTGTHYAVITVEWRGEYIESEDQYEREVYAYVLILNV